MIRIYEELDKLIAEGRACALTTLVGASGSSPQNTGAKVIFLPDGRMIGTIGGGCLEAEARRIGLECLRTGEPRLFDLRLDDDFGWDDGLICGGRVTLFINPRPERSAEAFRAALEAARRRQRAALCTTVKGCTEGLGRTEFVQPNLPGPLATEAAAALEAGRERLVQAADGSTLYVEPVLPRPTALIAGAGHVGKVLGQVLSLAGFEVVIVDDRALFANPERLPFADRVEVADIPGFVRDYPIDTDTFVVIVTRGHRHDAQVLRECIHSPARYIGMIGSRRKITVIYEQFLREGIASPDDLRRVHSPMGLTLGDREVGEIAVSIAAEMIAVRRDADLAAIRPMQYHPPCVRGQSGQ